MPEGVGLERGAAFIALGWLIGSLLLMARSVREGRNLAAELALRHPGLYEELGRPRPGFLQSVRRDRFAQFVARREYEGLGDPPLAVRFEGYRKSEARLVKGVLVAMAGVAVLALVVRRGS